MNFFKFGILILFWQAVSAQADIPVTTPMRQRICELVSKKVASGFDSNLKQYSVRECLENAEFYIADEYHRDGKPEYRIEMHDSNIAELADSERWLACDLTVKGPLQIKNLKLNGCSIKQ